MRSVSVQVRLGCAHCGQYADWNLGPAGIVMRLDAWCPCDAPMPTLQPVPDLSSGMLTTRSVVYATLGR